LFIFLFISIDTEYHAFIPYFHPTHRGRFKQSCSEVLQHRTGLLRVQTVSRRTGCVMLFAEEQSICCVAVYLAAK